MFGFLYVLPTNVPKLPLSPFTFHLPWEDKWGHCWDTGQEDPRKFPSMLDAPGTETMCAHAGAHTSIWGSEPTSRPPGVCFHCSMASPVL